MSFQQLIHQSKQLSANKKIFNEYKFDYLMKVSEFALDLWTSEEVLLTDAIHIALAINNYDQSKSRGYIQVLNKEQETFLYRFLNTDLKFEIVEMSKLLTYEHQYVSHIVFFRKKKFSSKIIRDIFYFYEFNFGRVDRVIVEKIHFNSKKENEIRSLSFLIADDFFRFYVLERENLEYEDVYRNTLNMTECCYIDNKRVPIHKLLSPNLHFLQTDGI